jgi:hypothetical protein
MRNDLVVSETITINAEVGKVWKALTDAYSGRIFHSFRFLVSTHSGNNFPLNPELVSTRSGVTFHA